MKQLILIVFFAAAIIVYSVEPDKLIWAGTTKTVNPTKLNKTVNEIADVVSDKMRKDGFLK